MNDIPGIGDLSTAEKILLAEELWDSAATDDSTVPLPAGHARELDRRLKRHNANPGQLLTLEELQSRLQTGK